MILSDGTNSQYSILRCGSWNGSEGCTTQDNYVGTATGADGVTWYIYNANIPAGWNTGSLAVTMRHWVDSWDSTTASNYYYFDYYDDFKIRKYVSPDPTTSVGAEKQLVTMAGTGATSWSWKVPAAASMFPAAAPPAGSGPPGPTTVPASQYPTALPLTGHGIRNFLLYNIEI
jgi:hypothetical protein